MFARNLVSGLAASFGGLLLALGVTHGAAAKPTVAFDTGVTTSAEKGVQVAQYNRRIYMNRYSRYGRGPVYMNRGVMNRNVLTRDKLMINRNMFWA